VKSSFRAAASVAFLIAAAPAMAGTPADPTRPSPKWVNAQPDASGAAKVKEQPMETQVILHGQGRKIIVVDGVMVRVGETYNGDRLKEVKRNEVIWKRSALPERDTPRPAIYKSNVKNGE
jgi:hypothetical protein